MRVQQRTSKASKVRVSRVVHFDDSPWVRSCSNGLPIHDNLFLGANDGKRHQTPQFAVVCNRLLVVLFNVVGKVVDGDAVILNVLHNLGGGGIGTSVSASVRRLVTLHSLAS